jgi:hypothetical protein
MRRLFTLAFYLLLISAGAYLAWGFFEFGGRRISGVAGGSLFLFGAYMLWLDFLSSERLARPDNPRRRPDQ